MRRKGLVKLSTWRELEEQIWWICKSSLLLCSPNLPTQNFRCFDITVTLIFVKFYIFELIIQFGQKDLRKKIHFGLLTSQLKSSQHLFWQIHLLQKIGHKQIWTRKWNFYLFKNKFRKSLVNVIMGVRNVGNKTNLQKGL